MYTCITLNNKQMNTLQEIKTLALDLMAEHNLHDWTFVWSNAKRVMGSCNYSKKVIKLSAVASPLRDIKEVKNTILHEIAHALVGIGHNHDYVWTMKALEIGCNGDRCSSDEINIQAKYMVKCDCGQVHRAHRKPKREHWCRCKGRAFNPLETLQYVQQY